MEGQFSLKAVISCGNCKQQGNPDIQKKRSSLLCAFFVLIFNRLHVACMMPSITCASLNQTLSLDLKKKQEVRVWEVVCILKACFTTKPMAVLDHRDFNPLWARLQCKLRLAYRSPEWVVKFLNNTLTVLTLFLFILLLLFFFVFLSRSSVTHEKMILVVLYCRMEVTKHNLYLPPGTQTILYFWILLLICTC